MKLSALFPLKEASQRDLVTDFKNIDFIGEDEGLQSFDLEVTYNYTSESYTSHPYGEGSAKEHFPATVQITKLITTSNVVQHDDDGNVIRTWPKGQDVKRLPGWKEIELDWFIDKIVDQDH